MQFHEITLGEYYLVTSKIHGNNEVVSLVKVHNKKQYPDGSYSLLCRNNKRLCYFYCNSETDDAEENCPNFDPMYFQSIRPV